MVLNLLQICSMIGDLSNIWILYLSIVNLTMMCYLNLCCLPTPARHLLMICKLHSLILLKLKNVKHLSHQHPVAHHLGLLRIPKPVHFILPKILMKGACFRLKLPRRKLCDRSKFCLQ
ncbi:hypothetical protein PR048_017156 [Dryococelus australis]|uniref:Uncharacterized protein n=1 Tax=Dryococelus australis TaxID=614101 RepID=A0ABQ9H8W8_9NEOP|nr:hypothetical protein PR048_017156 [Dryococelus australis]